MVRFTRWFGGSGAGCRVLSWQRYPVLYRWQGCASVYAFIFFFFSSRRRHTRCLSDWSSDVCSSDLDNRTRGRVTGEIWLAGIDEPLVLELAGDCAPDLAGCELSFENPDPVPMTTKPPAPQQRGPAGDITAARKVRVFDVSIEEALAISRRGETPPEHMANGEEP